MTNPKMHIKNVRLRDSVLAIPHLKNVLNVIISRSGVWGAALYAEISNNIRSKR